MRAIPSVLLSAVALYFSFNLGDCWPLAWLAAVPVLWLAFGETRSWIVFLSAWAAFALGATNLLSAYGSLFPVPLLMVMLGGPALLFAVSVAGARVLARRDGPVAGVLAFAVLWTGCDYLTSFDRNGACLSPAYSQIKAPFLIQGASVFGLWIVTFVLSFVAAGLAMSLRIRRPLPLGLAVAVFATNAVFGVCRIETAATGPSTRVGLASDDSMLRASFVSTAASADQTVDDYVGAARQLAAQGAKLIVFPEKLAFVEAPWRSAVDAKLAAAARETGSAIVIGFDDRGREEVNEALAFLPPAEAPRTYLKRRLVPVFEDRYKKGSSNLVLPDRVGVTICKDMDYPSLLRGDQRAGHPTLLAVPAWDFDQDALLHARPAMMRGVEDGFALARASREGLLTLTDAYGRAVAIKRTSAAGMATLVGNLARGPGDTVYVHLGDIFGQLCAATTVILLGWVALLNFRPERSRKSEDHRPEPLPVLPTVK